MRNPQQLRWVAPTLAIGVVFILCLLIGGTRLFAAAGAEGRRDRARPAGRANLYRGQAVLVLPLQAVHHLEEDKTRQGGLGEHAGEVSD